MKTLNETMEFICNSLSLNDEFVDKLFTAFDVDMDESQVHDILDACAQSNNYHEFGNRLIAEIYDTVIENNTGDNGPLSEDDFKYNVDNYCSTLEYKGQLINSQKQLTNIINDQKKHEQWEAQKAEPREFHLTDDDKQLLLNSGYRPEDMDQIELECNVCVYERYYSRKPNQPLTRDEVIKLLGRENWLHGIGRTAFHWSTEHEKGNIRIGFDSGIIGRNVNEYDLDD